MYFGIMKLMYLETMRHDICIVGGYPKAYSGILVKLHVICVFIFISIINTM